MSTLLHGDVLEQLKTIETGSVGMILTDPPYNIGYKGAEWDKIDNYIDWCRDWLLECCRVLRGNGTLIIWHQDLPTISQLMMMIDKDTPLRYSCYGLWHKPNHYKQAWANTNGRCTQRSWFNISEMFLVYNKITATDKTGLECIISNPNCFKSLKEYYKSELQRLGITEQRLKDRYKAVTGKGDGMFRHYFKDSQFAIPTQEVWVKVFKAEGFRREYEDLRREYEDLRREYEDLRPTFNILQGQQYSNYFVAQECKQNTGALHPCAKPIDIQETLIRVHSKPTDIVLDCFAGSGSVGVAAVRAGREFIGIERDDNYYNVAMQQIAAAQL